MSHSPDSRIKSLIWFPMMAVPSPWSSYWMFVVSSPPWLIADSPEGVSARSHRGSLGRAHLVF